jgi:hypothetical protein
MQEYYEELFEKDVYIAMVDDDDMMSSSDAGFLQGYESESEEESW